MVILRLKGGRVIGGFTEVSWDIKAETFKEDPRAFLFSCEPSWTIYPCVEPKKAVYSGPGVLFQFGYSDLVVLSNANQNLESYSYPSSAYPSIAFEKMMVDQSATELGEYQCTEKKTVLTNEGEANFMIEEIEVFQIV